MEITPGPTETAEQGQLEVLLSGVQETQIALFLNWVLLSNPIPLMRQKLTLCGVGASSVSPAQGRVSDLGHQWGSQTFGRSALWSCQRLSELPWPAVLGCSAGWLLHGVLLSGSPTSPGIRVPAPGHLRAGGCSAPGFLLCRTPREAVSPARLVPHWPFPSGGLGAPPRTQRTEPSSRAPTLLPQQVPFTSPLPKSRGTFWSPGGAQFSEDSLAYSRDLSQTFSECLWSSFTWGLAETNAWEKHFFLCVLSQPFYEFVTWANVENDMQKGMSERKRKMYGYYYTNSPHFFSVRISLTNLPFASRLFNSLSVSSRWQQHT